MREQKICHRVMSDSQVIILSHQSTLIHLRNSPNWKRSITLLVHAFDSQESKLFVLDVQSCGSDCDTVTVRERLSLSK